MEQLRTMATGDRYGALASGFQYELRRGYTALVGPNNAGKSALLQLIYRGLYDDPEFGAARIVLVLPDRLYMNPSSEVGGGTLSGYNDQLVGQMRGQPLPYQGGAGPARSDLAKLLFNDVSLLEQVQQLNRLLAALDYPEMRIAAGGRVTLQDIEVHLHGSGLRALLPIVAALSNPNVTAILIDEPELSLEPRLQRLLRDILVQESNSRTIVVTTHSHLFLHRGIVESTQVVSVDGGGVRVETVESFERLMDITFRLLGNSTEDLFFPSNYLVVEGASDQVIAERIAELLGTPSPRLKVLAAGGIDGVAPTLSSIRRALLPLYVADSPYAGRVGCIIDQPKDPSDAVLAKLKADLGEKLTVLPAESLETYLPSELYALAGRDRASDLQAINQEHDWQARQVLKRRISTAIAGALQREQFDLIPEFVAAVQGAINRGSGAPSTTTSSSAN